MVRQAFILTILVCLFGLSVQSKRKTCAVLYADDCTNLPCCTPGPFGPISCYRVDHGRRCFVSARMLGICMEDDCIAYVSLIAGWIINVGVAEPK
ncbi:hypothetical protein PoB_004041700 [Plakobranchus ocellatus]|uniref:Prokineticin domain-containing protein n=1 Tax=Plakobranchus ocellatus TaxID=259542 RepID=A0AAV4B316_9GAST|nr:hypothetical protein PoB_004041700 [Plakobranchus ocellatus]